MNTTHKSLIWAAIIIAAAILGVSMGLSGGASAAMVSGLTGAAYASIVGKRGGSCGRKCV